MTNSLAPLSGARIFVDSDKFRTKFKPGIRPSRASSRRPSPLLDVEATATEGVLDDAADTLLMDFFFLLFLKLFRIGNV
jgi:hypothetical protein